MKTIKKYWAIIVGLLVAILTFGYVIKKKSDNKKDKLDTKIKNNENAVSKLEGKVEVIETQKDKIKESIKEHEQLIENLETRKAIIAAEVLPVALAKENIISKTKRNHKSKKTK